MTDAISIPGAIEDRFDDLEPFARGDTGPSFRATERSSGRRGLLKLVHARLVAIEAERQRIKRELLRQATISHPHLAVPLASGEAEGTLWFFREFVEGRSLRERLDEEGALPVPEVLVVAAQLASALEALHGAGLLHRDLAPHHVVLRSDESGLPHAVLVDAAMAAPIKGAPQEAVGTPDYVAPELLSGRLASFRSDLYALGVVLFEMADGSLPFDGDRPEERMQARLRSEPHPVGDRLPGPVRDLLTRLLARTPKSRPFSAQDVRRVLEPLLPEGYRLPDVAPSKRPRRQRTLLGMAAVGGSAPPPPPSASRPPSAPPPPPSASRPPSAPPAGAKPTMLGMPALGSALPAVAVAGQEKPHAQDPTMQLDALDVEQDIEQHEVAPPPELAGMSPTPTPAPEAPANGAPKPFAQDPTMQLSPVDIEQAKVEPPAEIADMAATPAPAPVAPEAEGGAGEAQRFERAAAEVTPSPGVSALDFDEEAETRLREPDALESVPPASAVQEATPRTSNAPRASVAASPSSTEEGGGLGKTVGAFLAGVGVMAVIGWFVFGGTRQEPPLSEPRADAPTGEVALRQQAASEGDAPAPRTSEEPSTEEPQAAGAEPSEGSEGSAPASQPSKESQAGQDRTQRREHARQSAREPRRAASRRTRGSKRRGAASPFEQVRQQAKEAFQSGDFRKAAALYARATALNPRHAGAFAGLGASKMRLGDYRGAAAAYQQAVRLRPTHAGYFAALGHAYLAAGDRARAAAAYQRALALDPNHRGARQGMQRLGR